MPAILQLPLDESVIDDALAAFLPRSKWSDVGSRVYFLECNSHFVKIGWSTDVLARMNSLRASNPYPLEISALLDGGRDLEQRLHREFASLRTNGEWFVFAGSLQRFLSSRQAVRCRGLRDKPAPTISGNRYHSKALDVREVTEPRFDVQASLTVEGHRDGRVALRVSCMGADAEVFLLPSEADDVSADLKRAACVVRVDQARVRRGQLTALGPPPENGVD